ncbi:Hypp663 [Branchiostoma lanceolatum]|uniref:Hypp663 protein n=1 Tax=Branchiostoma lanceolatum TaxID=7740 RepID=A0A8J9VFJ1_BRALA|nr:Hypp663 [Branchiostoma lanceolatum]
MYETLAIVDDDNVPVEEKDRTVEQVMTAFEAYCNPKKNETVERHKFFTRSQASGETFDEYLTELRTLAAEYGFGAIKDSLIRDRILYGIRLLRETDLSLTKCGEICRTAECVQEKHPDDAHSSTHGEKETTCSSTDWKDVRKLEVLCQENQAEASPRFGLRFTAFDPALDWILPPIQPSIRGNRQNIATNSVTDSKNLESMPALLQ